MMVARSRGLMVDLAYRGSSPLLEPGWLSDRTPAEMVHWARLSSNRHMQAYVDRLVRTYPDWLRLHTIGSSAGGLPIRALHVLPPSGGRGGACPTVLIFAQQHGDEPAGKEACLLLLRELAAGSLQSLTRALDIWVVPQVNPDGADSGSRRNARRADLNRGHHMLGAPEQRALYRLYRRVSPHVTVDLHEIDVEANAFAGGEVISAYDLMADGPTNPNVGRAIRDLGTAGLEAVDLALSRLGYLFRRYMRGDPSEEGGRRLRYSTLHVFDGRNTPALLGSVAFIVEATRHRDLLARLERRVSTSFIALEALLRFAAERAAPVMEAARAERRSVPGRYVALRAEYVPTVTGSSVRYAITRPASGEAGELAPSWAATSVVISRERPLPLAYWVSSTLDRRRLARLLRAIRGHGISVTHAEAPMRAQVESFTIESVDQDEDGSGRMSFEVTSRIARRLVPAGALLIRTDQVGARLAAVVLEPDSMDGLLASGVWNLSPGRRYPVRRVLRLVRDERSGQTRALPRRT